MMRDAMPDPTAELVALVSRWYRLRRQGLCVPLLCEGGVLYTFDPVERWEAKHKIGLDELRRMCEEAEAGLRRPAGRAGTVEVLEALCA